MKTVNEAIYNTMMSWLELSIHEFLCKLYTACLVTCFVAFPSSTCLAFCPNSSVLMVSGTLDSSGLMFTNIHACIRGRYKKVGDDTWSDSSNYAVTTKLQFVPRPTNSRTNSCSITSMTIILRPLLLMQGKLGDTCHLNICRHSTILKKKIKY